MNNPYLHEFNAIGRHDFYNYTKRGELTKKYAWAIPDARAIDLIVKHSPIVEIGCGTGYWASLIMEHGGVIYPYDAHVPGVDVNPYRHKITYCDVLKGSIEVLDKLKFTLFLCWPPHDDSFAYDALMRYRGNTLIYVGESEGGCTATGAFFEELSKHWNSIESYGLPQWDGIHDYLEIYERA